MCRNYDSQPYYYIRFITGMQRKVNHEERASLHEFLRPSLVKRAKLYIAKLNYFKSI